MPPAAEKSPAEEGKHWWQRRKGGDETADAQPDAQPDLPRHVRVLPPDENDGASDPWEQGFDGPRAEELEEEMDEQTDEDALVEEPQRRRFRRR